MILIESIKGVEKVGRRILQKVRWGASDCLWASLIFWMLLPRNQNKVTKSGQTGPKKWQFPLENDSSFVSESQGIVKNNKTAKNKGFISWNFKMRIAEIEGWCHQGLPVAKTLAVQSIQRLDLQDLALALSQRRSAKQISKKIPC